MVVPGHGPGSYPEIISGWAEDQKKRVKRGRKKRAKRSRRNPGRYEAWIIFDGDSPDLRRRFASLADAKAWLSWFCELTEEYVVANGVKDVKTGKYLYGLDDCID